VTVEVNQSPAAPRPPYLYQGLIASLAVNLLFVGLFVAAFWHHEVQHPRPPADNGLLSFANQLSEEHQEPVKKEVAAAREAMKDLRASLRKSWLDANALLTEEPFDKGKFLAALLRLREMEDRYKTAIYNTVADTAGMLTPDERKLLQKWRASRRPMLLVPPTNASKPDSDSDKPLTD
jgi:uncharacterized membrane protein